MPEIVAAILPLWGGKLETKTLRMAKETDKKSPGPHDGMCYS